MPQKTNLNISPYYDDFSKDNQFYRVLFNPGRPVQARELSTLQSILQDQIETFGSHMFKEGSMVIPGNTSYDYEYYSLKLNSESINEYLSLNYLINDKTFFNEIKSLSPSSYIILNSKNYAKKTNWDKRNSNPYFIGFNI